MDRLQKAKGKLSLDVCPMCGGQTEERIVDLFEDLNGQMALIKGIHAEVCLQCGERLYSEAELRRIEDAREKIRSKKLSPVRSEQVQVFQV